MKKVLLILAILNFIFSQNEDSLKLDVFDIQNGIMLYKRGFQIEFEEKYTSAKMFINREPDALDVLQNLKLNRNYFSTFYSIQSEKINSSLNYSSISQSNLNDTHYILESRSKVLNLIDFSINYEMYNYSLGDYENQADSEVESKKIFKQYSRLGLSLTFIGNNIINDNLIRNNLINFAPKYIENSYLFNLILNKFDSKEDSHVVGRNHGPPEISILGPLNKKTPTIENLNLFSSYNFNTNLFSVTFNKKNLHIDDSYLLLNIEQKSDTLKLAYNLLSDNFNFGIAYKWNNKSTNFFKNGFSGNKDLVLETKNNAIEIGLNYNSLKDINFNESEYILSRIHKWVNPESYFQISSKIDLGNNKDIKYSSNIIYNFANFFNLEINYLSNKSTINNLQENMTANSQVRNNLIDDDELSFGFESKEFSPFLQDSYELSERTINKNYLDINLFSIISKDPNLEVTEKKLINNLYYGNSIIAEVNFSIWNIDYKSAEFNNISNNKFKFNLIYGYTDCLSFNLAYTSILNIFPNEFEFDSYFFKFRDLHFEFRDLTKKSILNLGVQYYFFDSILLKANYSFIKFVQRETYYPDLPDSDQNANALKIDLSYFF